jgi:hypothetical protein
MLDQNLSAQLVDDPWTSISMRAALPCTEEVYFGSSGATPTSPDSRRRYRRLRVRGKAAVQRGSETLGAYASDVSPIGIGFFSPVQLFPKERVVVTIEDGEPSELVITRCRRVRPRCYSCGGTFRNGTMGPGVYREFLRVLKL